MNLESITAAFFVGLLGGTHCAGMCGAIVGTLTSGLDGGIRAARGRFVMAQLAYNTGRISSYTVAGLLFGTMGQQAADWGWLEGFPVGRFIAGTIMILFGIYLAGWWHALLFLEKAGARLWKYIEPLGRRFVPVRTVGHALLLGMVWGWLPCGMVYAVLALALASGSGVEGGAIMLAFGLGTLPTMLTIGLAYHALRGVLQQRWLRVSAGLIVMLLGGMMLLANPAGHGHHAQPRQHSSEQGHTHH